MTCGIYCLRFKDTDKVYIGQSLCVENRLVEHIKALRDLSHSKKMLDAYKTYGEPYMEILCICKPEDLNDTENEAIEIFNSVNNGFNTNESADSCPILHGESNGYAKYTNDKIIEAFLLIASTDRGSLKSISDKTGVSLYVIKKISSGESHAWLKDLYPKEYSILLSNRSSLRRSTKFDTTGIQYPAVVSPLGDIFNITNVYKFTKEHGLHKGHFYDLLNSKITQHKGWKLA